MPWKEALREFSTLRISLISSSDRARVLVCRQWEPMQHELPENTLRRTELCPEFAEIMFVWFQCAQKPERWKDILVSHMLSLRVMLAAESVCFYLEKKSASSVLFEWIVIWNEREAGVPDDLGHKWSIFIFKWKSKWKRGDSKAASFGPGEQRPDASVGAKGYRRPANEEKMKAWQGGNWEVSPLVPARCLWAGLIFCLAACCKCLFCPVSVAV